MGIESGKSLMHIQFVKLIFVCKLFRNERKLNIKKKVVVVVVEVAVVVVVVVIILNSGGCVAVRTVWYLL